MTGSGDHGIVHGIHGTGIHGIGTPGIGIPGVGILGTGPGDHIVLGTPGVAHGILGTAPGRPRIIPEARVLEEPISPGPE